MVTQAQQQSFLQSIWGDVQRAGNVTGISPLLIAAQTALETGWGTSAPQNNYFGIKGNGGTQTTTEYVNGEAQTVQQNFAGYSSFQDSLNGWVALLTGYPRYAGVATAGTPDQQAQALASSGYATDPAYASKLQSVMGSISQLMGGSMSNTTQH
jgi:flagellar protein FlgJ